MSAGHDNSDNAGLDSDVLEAIAANAVPQSLDEDRRARMFDRITGSLKGPDGTTTLRSDEGTWRPFLDKVQIKVLRADVEARNRTVLLKLEPGAELPRHPHSQEEECLVLAGRICFGDFCLEPGDYHLAHAGHEHERLTAPDGALLLIRQEMHESVAP